MLFVTRPNTKFMHFSWQQRMERRRKKHVFHMTKIIRIKSISADTCPVPNGIPSYRPFAESALK